MFSIVIPTYNSALTISKALDSLLNQTYTNFEVLIIDAKSTDETLKSIQKINDKRIKIISEPDNGIYDAMNKGVRLAKGDWIYFLGSDDQLYTLDVLKDVSHIINESEIDLLYGNVLLSDSKKIYNGEYKYINLYNRNICHQAIFYRKALFAKKSFNTDYKALADWEFNLKQFGNPRINIKYTDKIIALFHNDGFSNNFLDESFLLKKPYLYLCHGYRVLSFDIIKKHAKRLIKSDRITWKQKMKVVFILIVSTLFKS